MEMRKGRMGDAFNTDRAAADAKQENTSVFLIN